MTRKEFYTQLKQEEISINEDILNEVLNFMSELDFDEVMDVITNC